MVLSLTSSTYVCSEHPLYYIIKDRGVGLMLASPSTGVKAIVGSVCDLSTMVVVNILLVELGPIPPLFIKSNFFIYFTKYFKHSTPYRYPIPTCAHLRII